MIDKILKEIDDQGYRYKTQMGDYRIITVELVKEIIKKHITIENAELWLEEQKEKNKNS